jgi:hypothetical protein
MNPSVVLHADKPRGSSAVQVAMIAATDHGREKCMTLSAPLVAKRRRCLLSLERGGLCTAATAILKLGAKLAF